MVIVVLAFLGLCLGSFVNALVWRVHQQTKKPKQAKKLSILNGRSMCPNCRHELAAKDLLPVASWLWLRGKCRYCGKSISVQYPAVELLTSFLFVFSYVFWPLELNNQGITLLAFWLAFLVGLIASAVYDIKWLLLPDKIVFFFMGLAILQSLVLVLIFNRSLEQIGQISLSFLIGGGLFYVIFQVSQGKWIGGGDVKLGMLLGLILADPALSLMMIFGASVLGTAFSLPLMATHKISKTTRIPFGPFLITGTILARLFGAVIISWYKGFLV